VAEERTATGTSPCVGTGSADGRFQIRLQRALCHPVSNYLAGRRELRHIRHIELAHGALRREQFGPVAEELRRAAFIGLHMRLLRRDDP